MILVLDVDETLIHSHDYPVPGSFQIDNYYVEKRPYLDEFLNNILQDDNLQVGIWSAGVYDYVWDIAQEIIPDINSLEFIMTRDNCVPINREGYRDYFKPLSLVNGQDILLVDNKPDVTTDCLRQILIDDFEGDKNDTELIRLWNYLDKNRGMSPEWLSTNWI